MFTSIIRFRSARESQPLTPTTRQQRKAHVNRPKK